MEKNKETKTLSPKLDVVFQALFGEFFDIIAICDKNTYLCDETTKTAAFTADWLSYGPKTSVNQS